jgi:hypothetical protein
MSEGGEASGPDPAVHALLNEHANSWWRRRHAMQIPERRAKARDDSLSPAGAGRAQGASSDERARERGEKEDQ